MRDQLLVTKPDGPELTSCRSVLQRRTTMISKNLGQWLRSGHHSKERLQMQIGLITDSVGHLPFESALDLAKDQGLSSVEVATGNWSAAPHADLPTLVASAEARAEFAEKISSRGLTLSALCANGNQLHPVEGPEHDKVVRNTITLASNLQVPTVRKNFADTAFWTAALTTDKDGLAEVNFIALDGLHALIALNNQCARTGTTWALIASHAVNQLLQVGDHDTRFPAVGSATEALRLVRRPSRGHRPPQLVSPTPSWLATRAKQKAWRPLSYVQYK